MAVDFDAEDIERLCPNARPDYVEALVASKQLLDDLDISDTAQRFCFFIAQLAHESGGLRLREENLNYSAKRLMQVWPKRFPTLAKAAQYANNPEKLANYTYDDANRSPQSRLGNVEPGDGWRFRGRGLIQTTGRYQYGRVGNLIGVDLIKDPDKAADPMTAVAIAAHLFVDKGCLPLCDKNDFVGVTKKINGGKIGLDDRTRYLVRAKTIFKDAPVKEPEAVKPPALPPPPTSIATSSEANAAVVIGGVSTATAGQEVANAMAKTNADGAFSMAEFVTNLTGSAWFWTTMIMALLALYIWLRRRARLLAWGV